MSFMDDLNNDLSIFFGEFAEEHLVNGKMLSVVIDNDQLMKRSKVEYQGLSVGQLLFFVKKNDLAKPNQWTPINFDNRPMFVFDVREDNGVLEIILTQNRGAG